MKVKRGGGGPCRAFLNELCRRLGRTLEDVLTSVNWKEQYYAVKRAGGPEWQELVRRGTLGTEAAQYGGSAFPPSRSPEDRIVAAGSESNDELRAFTASEVVRAAAAKEARRNLREDLATWSEVRNTTPDLIVEPPVGSHVFFVLRWVVNVLAFAEWAFDRIARKTFKRIRTIWENHHRMKKHKNCPRIRNRQPTDFQKKLCCTARMCLCSPDGRKLVALVARLIAEFRRMCVKGSWLRSKTVKGEVVLQLLSRMEWSQWLHMSHLNYTTFRGTTMRLFDTGLCATDPECKVLSTDKTDFYLGLETWWRQLRFIDKELIWKFRVWTLVSSTETVDLFHPGAYIVVRPAASIAPIQFWNGAQARKRPRLAALGPGGLEPEPLPLPDPEADGYDDGSIEDGDLQALAPLLDPIADGDADEAEHDEAEHDEEQHEEAPGEDNHGDEDAGAHHGPHDWDKIWNARGDGYIRLSWDRNSWKIRAVCKQEGHGECSVTRNCLEWRPLGLAWGYIEHKCESKAEHHLFRDSALLPDWTVREEARFTLLSASAAAMQFAQEERDYASLGPWVEDQDM